MADINKACKKLKSGDLIELRYDEFNSGRPMEVIATYSSHNSQGRNLSVGTIFTPKGGYTDTKLHRILLAEFNEIKGLVKLIPEKLF